MSLFDSPLSPVQLRTHPKRFACLFGLSIEAFDALFEKVYMAEVARQKRLHPLWIAERVERMGRKYRPLWQVYLGIPLLYLRQYPLQEVLAAGFALSQGQISKIIDRMSLLLEPVLPTPEGTLQAILAFVQGLPEDVLEAHAAPLIIDATEQRIERSVDQARQRADYSGKKCHSRKFQLIITQNQMILDLSFATPGSVHDFGL